MPNIAAFHPHLVHFVIALGFVGILLRILSLAGRGAWLNPAAAALILVAAGASIAAARSGLDAHGPVERVPGARQAVQEHEEWGNRTRNMLIILAGIEVLGLIWAGRKPGVGKGLRAFSAVAGVVAGVFIYEAAEHGGDLVYAYAGGIGIRSGIPQDVSNLLVAGLYHAAHLARDSGRAEESARLTEELARIRPDDPTVKFLAIESKLRDRKDAAGALADLQAMQGAQDDPRLAPRHGLLTAQALVATGRADSARMVLTSLATRFPNNRGIKDALAKLP